MASNDPVRQAWDAGVPAALAEFILRQEHHWRAREALLELREREWDLPIPPGGVLAQMLTDALGRPATLLTPAVGIYALSTVPCAIPDAREDRLGAVRHVVVSRRSVSEWTELSAVCQRGMTAAATWLFERFGPVDLPSLVDFDLARIPPLPALAELDQEGESAGLAAALACVDHLIPQHRHIAATGCLAGGGRVLAVDYIVEKIQGLVREAPFVGAVYVPRANAEELELLQPLDSLRIVPVDTVAEALDDCFGRTTARHLALIDPEEAAQRAAKFEVALDHQLADALAAAALAAVEREHTPEIHLEAMTIARAIKAITLVHFGQAKDAWSLFEEIDSHLQAASSVLRDQVLTRALMAQLTALRASALIDLLRPIDAVELCEQHALLTDGLELLPKIQFIGSWTRALVATGRPDDLEKAESLSQSLLELQLPRRHAGQGPRNVCTRLDVLMARHRRGLADDAGDIEKLLVLAAEENAKLPDKLSKAENLRYIRLWTTRWCALRGDSRRALASIEDIAQAAGRWPEHHAHRYWGEAIAADSGLPEKQRINDALSVLDQAAARIPEQCGEFLRLALLTSKARAALLRICNDVTGWRPQAEEFLSALHSWTDGRATVPTATDSPDTWASTLRSALDAFPY